jgi:hypothetical protein
MTTVLKRFHKPLVVISIIILLAAASIAQRRGGARGEAGFRFRFVGPVIGNRIAAVAGVAGDPSTYYAGAASGGVWKSVDGGNRWDAVFDDEPVSAIGALAVAPSDKSTVWAGTGEPWAIRDSDVTGNGFGRLHIRGIGIEPPLKEKIRPQGAGFFFRSTET